MLKRALWLTAAPLLALVVGACGSSVPSSQSLIQRASAVMAQSSYRLVGSTRAGQTKISFSVKTLPNGDFSGQVDTVVPHSPTLTMDVVSLGSKVYVLSPMALAQLGIAALPGHLNPATTWVLQPAAVAARYRHSLAAFTGSGLAATLRRHLKGTLMVRATELQGQAAWLVEEKAAGSSLRLYIDRGSYELLQLTITGRRAISLRYDHFGLIGAVSPPPAGQIYVPPTPAPGT
ncbi:MAG TPA: hypothetical protein VMV23_04035 [Candidatus Nanopelagicaceae bacterium]|nr:hypothetical protein [Candidatus Nanopelagicaceae bacterium]